MASDRRCRRAHRHRRAQCGLCPARKPRAHRGRRGARDHPTNRTPCRAITGAMWPWSAPNARAAPSCSAPQPQASRAGATLRAENTNCSNCAIASMGRNFRSSASSTCGSKKSRTAKGAPSILSEAPAACHRSAHSARGAGHPFSESPRLLGLDPVPRLRARDRVSALQRLAGASSQRGKARLPHLRVSPVAACASVLSCRDPGLRFAGYGTERAEETLRRVFPMLRIARVDADSMSRQSPAPRYAQRLQGAPARPSDRHTDDRQGAALSKRDARRHPQRGPRPPHSRISAPANEHSSS